jgi:hypothetical protein
VQGHEDGVSLEVVLVVVLVVALAVVVRSGTAAGMG